MAKSLCQSGHAPPIHNSDSDSVDDTDIASSRPEACATRPLLSSIMDQLLHMNTRLDVHIDESRASFNELWDQEDDIIIAVCHTYRQLRLHLFLFLVGFSALDGLTGKVLAYVGFMVFYRHVNALYRHMDDICTFL